MDLRTELELTIEQVKRDRFSVLYLGNNHLKRLPSSIGDLPNLAELDLRCNQLATVPDNIGNLSRLVKLNLRYNQLATLPDSIGNLSNLVELNLRYNQLTSLPDSIGNLSKLTYLDLGYNQLSALPDSFRNLASLATLYINVNSVKDLSLLQDLPKLQSLYLFGKLLPRRYWTKFSDWKPEWFLDEDDWEMRRALVEQIGAERIIVTTQAGE